MGHRLETGIDRCEFLGVFDLERVYEFEVRVEFINIAVADAVGTIETLEKRFWVGGRALQVFAQINIALRVEHCVTEAPIAEVMIGQLPAGSIDADDDMIMHMLQEPRLIRRPRRRLRLPLRLRPRHILWPGPYQSYFGFDIDLDLEVDHTLDLDLDIGLDVLRHLDLDLDSHLDRDLGLDLEVDLDLILYIGLDPDFRV